MKQVELDIEKNRDDWHYLLDYLYQCWIDAGLQVTTYPAAYCKGALRLHGIISKGSIGRIA